MPPDAFQPFCAFPLICACHPFVLATHLCLPPICACRPFVHAAHLCLLPICAFLIHTAETNSELSLLTINTLQKDSKDEDPIIRGLALRSFCNLRINNLFEYIEGPLFNGLNDKNSYVRRIAIISCIKLIKMNPHISIKNDVIKILKSKLLDKDSQCIINSVHALNEILIDEGGLKVNKEIIFNMLNKMSTFNEWGKCVVLNIVSTYIPENEDEMYDIMNILENHIRDFSSAVFLACLKCFLNFSVNDSNLQIKIFQRMKDPLLTLISTSSYEISYIVLLHTHLLLHEANKLNCDIFDYDYKHFFFRHNDLTYIKDIKLDILVSVASKVGKSLAHAVECIRVHAYVHTFASAYVHTYLRTYMRSYMCTYMRTSLCVPLTPQNNVVFIINELSEYISDESVEVAKKAIYSIGCIALKIPKSISRIVDLALSTFLPTNSTYICSATIQMLANILRKYEEYTKVIIEEIIKHDNKLIDDVGIISYIWIVGEYCEHIENAPYILEEYVNLIDCSYLFMLELLTACMKVLYRRPSEMKIVLLTLFDNILKNYKYPELTDKMYFYYKMLSYNYEEAFNIIACKKKLVKNFCESNENILLDKLYTQFNTLSVLYKHPVNKYVEYSKICFGGTYDPGENCHSSGGASENDDNCAERKTYTTLLKGSDHGSYNQPGREYNSKQAENAGCIGNNHDTRSSSSNVNRGETSTGIGQKGNNNLLNIGEDILLIDSNRDGGNRDGGNRGGGNRDRGNRDGGNRDGGNRDGGNSDGGNSDWDNRSCSGISADLSSHRQNGESSNAHTLLHTDSCRYDRSNGNYSSAYANEEKRKSHKHSDVLNTENFKKLKEILINAESINPEHYQEQWNILPEQNNEKIFLRKNYYNLELETIDELISKYNIVTLASGEIDQCLKFYMYSQFYTKQYIFIELIFNKAENSINWVLKSQCENPDVVEKFTDHFRDIFIDYM
ncbi:adapter-related protein complex 4 beta 1 subunit [Plasmodium ovale wallikeri]|uniref:Adapter-related protein complex 4 beta 1 subunit n=1 Tax=Plasmodium ovale wallikeri TaxID=864142 RepID=A0A1A8YH44_PLAOA|nr:adapter-related protein complex 4 beta 1 subunit [Plasmodium ovale wallikeri]SBT31494.1 adapter-related protein complex 4 beta 1 subunit [Plasmodium ovale wallikeri]